MDIFRSLNLNLLIILSILIALILIAVFSYINIILYSNFSEKNVQIKLNIKFLFGLINYERQVYPDEKNKNKKVRKEEHRYKEVILVEDIVGIIEILKHIKIEEFYSNIEYGNKNVAFTSFIFIFINTIYGNIINLINPDKMYLNVKPDYLNDYLDGYIKIHTRVNIRDLLRLIIRVSRMMKRKNGEFKKGDVDESDRVNKESYGDNC